MFRKAFIGLALAAVGVTTLPAAAEARHGDRGRYGNYETGRYYEHDGRYGEYRQAQRYYRGDRYRDRCRRGGTTGTIVGGAAGALLGREVDRYGDRTPGTVIGGVAGALLGREIERNRRC
jgi:uncharacterized protein YcfJ